MDTLWSAFTVLLFAAVFLLCEGAWLWWHGSRGGGARRIARRLHLMSVRSGTGAPEGVRERRHEAERLLRRLPQAAVLNRLLLQAGWRWPLLRLLGAQAAALAAGVLLPLALRLPAMPALVLGLCCCGAPAMLLLRARAARLRRVEEQLPELAEFLARALRAGHSFANVLQMAGDEVADPLGGEMRATYEEVNFGIALNEALQNLAARVPLTDLRYLVIAVLIQRESGGNLAELLDNVARMTRARLQLLAQVRVMSAEGRMSAWILTLLPIGVLSIMQLGNPGYVSVLWRDPTGQRLVWYAVAAVLVGMLWMRKLVRIRV